MLKVQEIREIIKLIDQSSISEFTYETEGTNISLKKSSVVNARTEETVNTGNAGHKPSSMQVKEEPAEKKEEREEKIEERNETTVQKTENKDYDYEVVSPMVGTFYAAPSPEEDAYVSVGSKVEPQTIVCIVEAMKLFNEIEAEVSGEIVEVIAENGELVEYGQPLFRVKKK